MSKDDLELTFKLRKGVKFHDGTPLDADAVVFSLKRQNDKNHPFNKFGPWKYWSVQGLVGHRQEARADQGHRQGG